MKIVKIGRIVRQRGGIDQENIFVPRNNEYGVDWMFQEMNEDDEDYAINVV